MALKAKPETKEERARNTSLKKPFCLRIVCLPQLILNFILQRCNFRLLVMFGSLKIPIKINVAISFASFRVMAIQFSFTKSKFGDFKSSSE